MEEQWYKALRQQGTTITTQKGCARSKILISTHFVEQILEIITPRRCVSVYSQQCARPRQEKCKPAISNAKKDLSVHVHKSTQTPTLQKGLKTGRTDLDQLQGKGMRAGTGIIRYYRSGTKTQRTLLPALCLACTFFAVPRASSTAAIHRSSAPQGNQAAFMPCLSGNMRRLWRCGTGTNGPLPSCTLLIEISTESWKILEDPDMQLMQYA
jgi:hypothetical protein